MTDGRRPRAAARQPQAARGSARSSTASSTRAEKQQLSYVEPCSRRLLREEWQHRQRARIEYRIKAPAPRALDARDLPLRKQPGVNGRRSEQLAELDFVGRAANLVFIGDTGVGKTGLATGILLEALENGYRGVFIKAQDLFDEMYASLADRSSRKLVDRLSASTSR